MEFKERYLYPDVIIDWAVDFYIEVNGHPTVYSTLPEEIQNHILKNIIEGYTEGQIIQIRSIS